MLRAAHRRGRIDRHDLADNKPIEQHADRCELLLDRRRRNLGLQLLYICGDVVWPDRCRRQVLILAPREEPGAGPRIGPARVRVADVGGEEFDIAPRGLVAEISDERRDDVRGAWVGGDVGLLDGRRKLVSRVVQNEPPYPDISRLIKDVIIREPDAQGAGAPTTLSFCRSRQNDSLCGVGRVLVAHGSGVLLMVWWVAQSKIRLSYPCTSAV